MKIEHPCGPLKLPIGVVLDDVEPGALTYVYQYDPFEFWFLGGAPFFRALGRFANGNNPLTAFMPVLINENGLLQPWDWK